MNRWHSPLWTKWIRNVIDTCIPIALRDQRWFYVPIIRMWNPGMDPGFQNQSNSYGGTGITTGL